MVETICIISDISFRERLCIKIDYTVRVVEKRGSGYMTLYLILCPVVHLVGVDTMLDPLP